MFDSDFFVADFLELHANTKLGRTGKALHLDLGPLFIQHIYISHFLVWFSVFLDLRCIFILSTGSDIKLGFAGDIKNVWLARKTPVFYLCFFARGAYRLGCTIFVSLGCYGASLVFGKKEMDVAIFLAEWARLGVFCTRWDFGF